MGADNQAEKVLARLDKTEFEQRMQQLLEKRKDLANICEAKHHEWTKAVQVLDGFEQAIEILQKERKHGS